MLLYMGFFMQRASFLGMNQYSFDENTPIEQLWPILKEFLTLGKGYEVMMVASICAFICSILAFYKTTAVSSGIRTVFLGLFAYFNVRAFIIYHAFDSLPYTYEESFREIINSTFAFGGLTSLICSIVMMFMLPILFVTSIFAVIKLIRNPYPGIEKMDGDWNV